MTLRHSQLTEVWVIKTCWQKRCVFQPNIVQCLWGCLRFTLIDIMLKSLKGKYLKQQTERKKGVFSINTTAALKVNECNAPVPSGSDSAEMQILLRSSSSCRVASDVTWHVSSCKTLLSGTACVALGAQEWRQFNSALRKKTWNQSTWKWSLALISALSSGAQVGFPPRKHISLFPLIPSQGPSGEVSWLTVMLLCRAKHKTKQCQLDGKTRSFSPTARMNKFLNKVIAVVIQFNANEM